MKKFFAMLLAAVFVCSATVSASENFLSMSYRNNSVVMTADNGLSIQSGYYLITDLCITSGQDPDGRNYIGQTVAIQNSQLAFSVGRRGSEEVAAWFNEKVSGYNDPSLNGDRTTFDHTAGDLNFAFSGTLVLQIVGEQYPQGIQVEFPEVLIAQGSTMFSNNWWFGQKSGQHTQDSDGSNTVLTIGNTADGRQVYASFLRGGNGTNQISLEGVSILTPASDRVTEAVNVQAQLQNLQLTGTEVDLYGFPGSYDPTVNHIQGYARYRNAEYGEYSILTHSVSTAEYAHIIAGLKAGDSKTGYKTYLSGWKHPGGIAVLGDYLLVPSEADSSAHIALYDLRSLTVGELRRVESFGLAVNHKAGALAITTYRMNGFEYYLLLVAHLDEENTVYHAYSAPAADGLENACFFEVGSFALEKDFQGFGLVTEEETGTVYLIGLWSPGEGASFADYVYLYQFNTDAFTIGEELMSAHLYSTGGGTGMLGVHFRYGANVFVNSDGSITLSATERNSVLGAALTVNEWNNQTD